MTATALRRLLLAIGVWALLGPAAAFADVRDGVDVGRVGRGRKYNLLVEAGFSNFIPSQKIYSDNYGALNPGATLRLGISSASILRDAFGLYKSEGGVLQFSLGAGYNYSSREKYPVLPDLKDKIHSIPLDLTLAYHMRYSPKQWIWPSIGAGPDFDIYVNKVTDASHPALNDTTKGMKYGWHVETQLNVSMNRFDRHAASTARRTGLSDTFLFTRARWRMAQTPGGKAVAGTSSEGIRFTGWLLDAGIGFQFR